MKTKALYVHIPFCDHICSYCDFCKVLYREKTANDYLAVLKKEIESLNIKENLDTIFIGGGTPSSLDDTQLEDLLICLKPYANNVKEYSIEVNPESMDYYKLKILKQYGITRLSIGVQTFNNDLLKSINRLHNKTQVISIIKYATKIGIENISIDLMYGLPGQTINDIKNDLKEALSLPITHISYYSLILEDNTKLKLDNYQPIDEETSYQINMLIDNTLSKNGFNKYEVSNYSKAGYQSMHNKAYWHYDNYYGVGVGATSKIDNQIITHSKSLTKYLQNEDITSIEGLSLEDTMFNNLMMSLRLLEGLDLNAFTARYNQDALKVYEEVILKQKNNLEIINNHLRVKEDKIYLLNEILMDFL
ncbi:MAG: radical SAM family heme chaperone HemW [Thomasclavelia sp.]|nr:radical SAM family heme chaperone HemW [Thomasclavelia sp.]